jgi:small subunit ribosomal protein S14
MPSKSLILKANKTPKYSTRKFYICLFCGRTGGNLRPYKNLETRLCRIDFRNQIYKGLLPGWKKGSW